MIDNLFKYYLENQDILVEKYNGKHIVITKDGVVGAYDSEAEAYYKAKEQYGLGNFLLQLCTPGTDAYTQHFYTPQVKFV